MADVSIIIPVYNSEQWLADCLESVIGQTLRDIEVILIDDGSTDRSGAICDEYAAMDQRLKVIHTLNEGVSAARQKGLETATGNYIIHVDADDWIDRNYIEVLYNYAEQWQTDILICDYYKENNDKSLLIRQKPVSLVPKDVQHQLFHGLHGSLCNKLVRRSVYSGRMYRVGKRQGQSGKGQSQTFADAVSYFGTDAGRNFLWQAYAAGNLSASGRIKLRML